MMQNMRMGVPALFKQGTKHYSGKDQTVMRNVEACQALSSITRTSLGPNGMNKMVINHLDRMFVTSDAATIISEMEVQHPAAKMLVLAAQMQEKEVGDGSNFVVVFAGELLGKAGELVDMGLHTTEIINGFNLAYERAMQLFDELVVWKLDTKDLRKEDVVARAVLSSIASKQSGNEKFIAQLVAKACVSVMPTNTYNFNVDNVRVLKLLGGNLYQSEVIRGMMVPQPMIGSIRDVHDARVAVFKCPIDTAATENKGTVLINNAEELLSYNEGEERDIQAKIKAIKDSGVNVVVTDQSVGEMAKHFLEKYKIVCVKLSSAWELRRVQRACDAKPVMHLGPVHPDDQGFCKRIYSREFGDKRATVFQQEAKDKCGVASIILRGSTNNILNDIERAIDDGVNTVKAVGRDPRFLAGAGAWDVEMTRLLRQFGSEQEGLEQYAVNAFADSLEVVPRTLAENAGQKALDMFAQLYAAHEKESERKVGIDVVTGGVKDMTTEDIFDQVTVKSNAMRLAVDTVLTILRVDQIIQSKPAGGPKIGQKQGHWDDTD